MHSPDHIALQSAIQALFVEYLKNPLYYLREAGLQARLLQLIHEKLASNGRHETANTVVDESHRHRFSRPKKPGVMARTQIEVRVDASNVQESHGVEDETKVKIPDAKLRRNAEKSDLVVLRHAAAGDTPVQLTNYPNGPLDIVRIIDIGDVDAVIELKATVSSDVSMRHLFREDVAKLLRLKACRPDLSAHFVLVDKSLAVKEHAHEPNNDWGRPVSWWNDPFTSTRNKRRLEWDASNRSVKITAIEDGQEENLSGVHVWQLARVTDSDPESDLLCRHFIAVAGPQS